MSKPKNLLEMEFTESFFKLMPEWQVPELDVKILNGGITNKLYRVQSENARDNIEFIKKEYNVKV